MPAAFLDEPCGDESIDRIAKAMGQHASEVGAGSDVVGELGQRAIRIATKYAEELLVERRDGFCHSSPNVRGPDELDMSAHPVLTDRATMGTPCEF